MTTEDTLKNISINSEAELFEIYVDSGQYDSDDKIQAYANGFRDATELYRYIFELILTRKET